MNNISIVQLKSNDPIALILMDELAQELNHRYDSASSEPKLTCTNQIAFLVAFYNHYAVGCGAMCGINQEIAEIKRVYVRSSFRTFGIAKQIITKIEEIALLYHYKKLILQTGSKQPEAIGLYETMGFNHIEPFGEYRNDPVSVCFEKILY